MARRVRFFANQIEKEKDPVPVRPLYDSVPLVTVGPRVAQTIDELEVKLADHEQRVIQMNQSYQTMSERTRELVEARYVLRETAVFFDRAQGHETEIRRSMDDSSQPLLGHGDPDTHALAGNISFDLEWVDYIYIY